MAASPSDSWWIVYWSHPQAGRGAVATNGHAFIQAATAAAAQAKYLKGDPKADITNVLGPYTTQAAAQTTASSPATSATGTTTSGAADNFPNITDPLSGLAGSITAFYHAATDGKMWRSLGWIILGILLMWIGMLLWIGPSAGRASPIGVAAATARGVVS